MKFEINGKNVKSIDYDLSTSQLIVVFQNNRKYQYDDVELSWIVKMVGQNADSIPRELGKTKKYKEL